jgi:hypothetical protein
LYTRSNKASDTAPLIKIIYDIKSVANIGCLCNATFANTPLTINNDPLVVPLCNETDLFISQSLKEKIWGLQYINLALLLHQNFDVPSEPKMNRLTVLNGNVGLINKSVSLHKGTTNRSLLIVNGVFSEIKTSRHVKEQTDFN